jgi:hypothetical protein
VIQKIEVRASLATVGRGGAEVLIDGKPLPGVVSADVSTAPGYIPTVTVELQAAEVVVDGELQIELTAGTAEALKELGWTAPSETPEVGRG